jgi:hypothetical protein
VEEAKTATTGKPGIVLLPVSGQGLSESDLSIYRSALAEALGEKYNVKFGEQTDQIISEVFKSHSAESLECDESKCYRDVAVALNVTLIAKGMISKAGNDYKISVVIYNVLENRAEQSRVAVCESCGLEKMLEKLKVTAAPTSKGVESQLTKDAVNAREKIEEKFPPKEPEPKAEEAKVEEKSIFKKWWFWTLVVALGGGAVAAGGGSKGGGSTTPGSNGGMAFNW